MSDGNLAKKICRKRRKTVGADRIFAKTCDGGIKEC